MPESTSRKRKPARAAKPQGPRDHTLAKGEMPNPVWFQPLMFGLMIVGFLWIVTYYLTNMQYPLGSATPWDIQSWNILVGFGVIMAGFMMTTRWK